MDLEDILNRIKTTEIDSSNRRKWYQLFSNEIYNHIDRLEDESTKIISILELLTIRNKDILNSSSTEERFINEIELDVLNNTLDQLNVTFREKIKDFTFYPELHDTDFNQQIYNKQEFLDNKIPKHVEKKSIKAFHKSSTQQFVSNFISEYTPYNGILLWHGVGTGKTCAAISIAENFRNVVYQNDKKILILTPSDTLKGSWQNEIFNIEKEKNKGNIDGNVQCTGYRYTDKLKDFIESPKILQKRNKLIKTYYEIAGYQKWTGSIESEFNRISELYARNKDKIEYYKIKYIQKHFSNRVIIMDEVHETRVVGDGDTKKSRPYLEMVARYGKNNKMILLSATPMYNITVEIVWLLNLLLWNDKRGPIESETLFKPDGLELQNEDAKRLLIEKSRGYISYLRGEDPFSFPLKVYPENAYTPTPSKQFVNNSWVELEQQDTIQNIVFYKNELQEWQHRELLKYRPLGDEVEEILESNFNREPLQISNILFPSPDDDDDNGYIRKEGFEKSFIKNENNTYSYQEELDGFLHRDNIETYSIKFKNIIDNILTSTGIVFVFSQFIYHGILPFALALEENGFIRNDGDGKTSQLLNKKIKQTDRYCAVHKKYYGDLTTDEKRSFKQAKYIYLDGTMKKQDIDILVKEARSERNMNGEEVLVILGSNVVQQGISFFNVREVHIMDPWYHLNRMIQVIGRAVRRYSHKNLPPEKRNVMIFLHVASLPEEEYESVDEEIYRKAYFKKYKMAEIERLLKKNTVDCRLNKYGNIFTREDYPEPLQMINSKGVSIQGVKYNTNGDMICDFNECNYTCDSGMEPIIPNTNCKQYKKTKDPKCKEQEGCEWAKGMDGKKGTCVSKRGPVVAMEPIINKDTYGYFNSQDVDYIKEIIKVLYKNNETYSFSLEDIRQSITEYVDGITDDTIYIALNELLENKETVYDLYERPGTILYRKDYYIYQPDEVKNIHIPMVYRKKMPHIKKTKIEIKPVKSPEKTPDMEVIHDHGIEVEELERYIHTHYEDYPSRQDGDENRGPFREDLIKSLIHYKIERLSIDQQKGLLIPILEDYIRDGEIDGFARDIIEYFDKTDDLMYYSILRNNRDMITHIRFKKDNGLDMELMEYDDLTKKFTNELTLRPNKLTKLSRFNLLELSKNDNRMYGYIKKKQFYVVNNIDFTGSTTLTGKVNKKDIRSGAVCGHGINVTKIGEIKHTINEVLGYKKYCDTCIKVGKNKKKCEKKCEKKPKKKTSTKSGRSLCEELELILRYKQNNQLQGEGVGGETKEGVGGETKEGDGKHFVWFYKQYSIKV